MINIHRVVTEDKPEVETAIFSVGTLSRPNQLPLNVGMYHSIPYDGQLTVYSH